MEIQKLITENSKLRTDYLKNHDLTLWLSVLEEFN
jgi:hypothetical protein